MLFVVFVLSSCSDSNQDLLDKFEEVKSRKGHPIEPIPDVKFVPKYVYPSHLKRRNPFFKYEDKVSAKEIEGGRANLNAPDLNRAKEVLESFGLRDLRMVGLLKQDGQTWGIISSPEDKIYKVTVGRYMGKHYGKVTVINDDNIIVIEKYKNKNVWEKRKAVIKLDVNNTKMVN